ncbi:LxmA leader domain family RiPP [Microbacterium sp.]|uniref:LxmA leader domain family RiPP n=1 Tax=Microbacterium sp. TaxID=51671 RepID=UPI003A8638F0
MTAIDIADVQAQSLAQLAEGHETFTTADEIGADASSEAPATSPFCVGVIVGATLGAGC